MTKKQTIQIRISESDKVTLDNFVGYLQQDDPSLNMTSFIMDALQNYYSEFKIEKDSNGKAKAVRGKKFVFKDNTQLDSSSIYKMSVEQRELSVVTNDRLTLENIKNFENKKIHKLIGDFLFQLAVQKKREEHQAISENEKALIEELEKEIK